MNAWLIPVCTRVEFSTPELPSTGPLTTAAQISALDIVNGFVIEENGYFYDQGDVSNIGYWSYKKLAELLPYDYLPD